MIELLLSEPSRSGEWESDAAKTRIDVLKKLETIIWSVITSEGRSEARLWLCKTISCLRSVTPQAQCDVFVKLLMSRPRKIGLAAQLLQMIIEKKRHKLGGLIVKKSYILEKFFKGNPRRILQWFGNFAAVGESEHRKGARALSQFAFLNRNICWDELVWKGKHGQSPAVVATKPHYFQDLDVLRTVENFLENVPEFWTSDELAESVKEGEILFMDMNFFIDYFIDLMYEKELEEVWKVISEFLLQEPFSSLCHRLLVILEESDLYSFVKSLCRYHTLKVELQCVDHHYYWLELLLCMCSSCASIDELLLINAVVNQSRQLLRLVSDEEHEEERNKIGELVSEISNSSSVSDAALVRKCLTTNKADSVKWLGLQSWVIQYRLSEECKNPDSWEELFIRTDISFRKSSSYDLVRTAEFLEESSSSSDDGGSTRARRKGKTRKRRRRYYISDESNNDELVDVDTSYTRQDLKRTSGSWLLSTDNYSSSWNNMPVTSGLVEEFAKLIVSGACRGDSYVKFPSWYDTFMVYREFTPDIIRWTFNLLLPTDGSKRTTAYDGTGRPLLETSSLRKQLPEPTGSLTFEPSSVHQLKLE